MIGVLDAICDPLILALPKAFVLSAGMFLFADDEAEKDVLSFIKIWLILSIAIMPDELGSTIMASTIDGILFTLMEVYMIHWYIHEKMGERESTALLISLYIVLITQISKMFMVGMNYSLTNMISDFYHMILPFLYIEVIPGELYLNLPSDVLLSFILALLLMFFMRKKIRKITEGGLDIPFEGMIPLLVMVSIQDPLIVVASAGGASNIYSSYCTVFVCSAYILIPYSLFYIFNQLLLVKQLEEKEKHTKLATRLYQNQMHALIQDKELLTERHMFIDKLKMVKAMLDHNETSAALVAIQQILNVADDELAGMIAYTENQYLNLVLNYMHKQNDMEFEVVSTIDDNCGIDPIDLGIILMNLIYARIREEPENKKMEIALRRNEYSLVMRIGGKVLHDDKSSMEYAILKNKIAVYDGSLEYDEPGSTTIILYIPSKIYQNDQISETDIFNHSTYNSRQKMQNSI